MPDKWTDRLEAAREAYDKATSAAERPPFGLEDKYLDLADAAFDALIAAAREPSSEELWPFKALYFHLCDALGIEQMPSPGLIEWDTAVAQVRRLAEAAQEARDD